MKDIVTKARERPLGVSGMLQQRGEYREAVKDWQKQQKEQPPPEQLEQMPRKVGVVVEEGEEYKWFLKPEFVSGSLEEQGKIQSKVAEMPLEDIVAKYGDEKIPEGSWGAGKTYRELYEEWTKAQKEMMDRMERAKYFQGSGVGLQGRSTPASGPPRIGSTYGETTSSGPTGAGSVGYGGGTKSEVVYMGEAGAKVAEILRNRAMWDAMHEVATPTQWKQRLGDKYDDYSKALKFYEYNQYRTYANQVGRGRQLGNYISDDDFVMAHMPPEARKFIKEYESSPEFEEAREKNVIPTIVPQGVELFGEGFGKGSKSPSKVKSAKQSEPLASWYL